MPTNNEPPCTDSNKPLADDSPWKDLADTYKGDKGDKGQKGQQGDNGDKGDKG